MIQEGQKLEFLELNAAQIQQLKIAAHKIFPPDQIMKSNMLLLDAEKYVNIKHQEEILSLQIYTFEMGEINLRSFILLPNILIQMHLKNNNSNNNESDQFYLMLINCTISQLILSLNNSQIYTGQTLLFFYDNKQHHLCYKSLVQFCKLQGFREFFRVEDKILPGFYNCVKKKNNKQYAVQIYRIQAFEECPDLEEAIYNEIHILRSTKHSSLLELKQVYETNKYLFIVYEKFKGDSLLKLYRDGIQFDQVQIATIIFQIVQLVRFLHKYQYFHGSINPQNILIYTYNQCIYIKAINISFKEYKIDQSLDWFLHRQLDYCLAPEILQGVSPSIESDLFAIGCTLYFMTFYDASLYDHQKSENQESEQITDEFIIDLEKITQEKNKLTDPNVQQQVSQKISFSMIDLMTQLLDPIWENRLKIQQATKHHWFVNVKSQIKNNNMKRENKNFNFLPNLRTIIEMKEMSEKEIQMKQDMLNRKNSNNKKKKLSIQFVVATSPNYQLFSRINGKNNISNSMLQSSTNNPSTLIASHIDKLSQGMPVQFEEIDQENEENQENSKIILILLFSF